MTENLSDRDIMVQLKEKHTRSFNSYQVVAAHQKRFLELKAACYKPDGQPSDYYFCIKRTDEKIFKNSEFLRSKFGEIEVGSLSRGRGRQEAQALPELLRRFSGQPPQVSRREKPLAQRGRRHAVPAVLQQTAGLGFIQ